MFNDQNFYKNQQEYVSDYPSVFFTNGNQNIQYNSYVNDYNNRSSGILTNILNSNVIKQIIPFLLGTKDNSNNNLLSLLQNFTTNNNFNFNELVNSLGFLKKSNSTTKNENNTNSPNIIDMSEYEEINQN